MSAETYALAAVAAGVASEASGVTDVTPIGRGQGSADRPGAPDLASVLERARAASERTGGSQTSVNLDLGGLGQAQPGGGAAEALAAALAGQQQAAAEAQRRADEWREAARERTQDPTDAADDAAADGAEAVDRIVSYLENQAEGGPGFDPGGDLSGGSSFLDKTERAGGQVEAAGSGLKGAGADVLETVNKTGTTTREAARLLATGEADVSGTFDSRAGSDNTRIRRPTVSGAIRDRLPDRDRSSGSGSGGSDGPNLLEMAGDNVREELGGLF